MWVLNNCALSAIITTVFIISCILQFFEVVDDRKFIVKSAIYLQSSLFVSVNAANGQCELIETCGTTWVQVSSIKVYLF